MYIQENILITPSIATRLISLINTRVAIPVAPLPGEGLADLIYRAASVNGFPTPICVMPWLARGLSHRFIARSSIPISALADSLGLPNGEIDLEPLMYPRYDRKRRLQPDGNAVKNGLFGFFGRVLPCNQLVRGRRISPSALQESNHSQAIWHLGALGFDPASMEFLLERCPECGSNLDFNSTCGVANCFHCGPGVDFRRCRQPKVTVEDTEALTFVTSLVDPGRTPEVSNLHCDLRNLDPGEIFMLCALIGAVLEGRIAASSRERRQVLLEGLVSPEQLATAGRALLDWPEGFVKLADRINNDAVWGEGPHSIPPFEHFVRDDAVFTRPTWEAIKQLNLLPRTAMIPVRKVSTEPTANGRRHKFLQLAGRSDVVRCVSERTGIPAGVVFECLTSGSIDVPYASGKELHAHVIAEIAQIEKFAQEPMPDMRILRIKETVSALYRGLGNPWPQIITAIKDRSLPIVSSKTTSLLWLDTICIQDFQTWRNFCDGLIADKAFADVRLAYHDVGFYLDITTSTTCEVMRLVPPEKRAKTMRTLHSFRSEYITGREIRATLAIAGVTASIQQVNKLLDSFDVELLYRAASVRRRVSVEKCLPALLELKPSRPVN